MDPSTVSTTTTAAQSAAANLSLAQITGAITAIGALGTAAFGLVDASKVLPGFLPNAGFRYLRRMVDQLAPKSDKTVAHQSALTCTSITETLQANWISTMAIADQKSVAKTLIKLRLDSVSAPHLANLMGVDPVVLTAVAESLTNGTDLTPAQMNCYARFDVVLSTYIDRAYQRATQKYTATARFTAFLVSVVLAEVAALVLYPGSGTAAGIGFLVGVIATPLAPIAKDLATALNSAAKAVQSVKK